MSRQGKAPNRRSQAPLVLLCTGGVPLPTGASLRSLVRGNTQAGFWSRGGQSDLSIDCNWSLLRSWLRPPRGISQEKLPLYLGFFEFVHNVDRVPEQLNVSFHGHILATVCKRWPRHAVQVEGKRWTISHGF